MKKLAVIHNNEVKPSQDSKESNVQKVYAKYNKHTFKVLLPYVIFFPFFCQLCIFSFTAN